MAKQQETSGGANGTVEPGKPVLPGLDGNKLLRQMVEHTVKRVEDPLPDDDAFRDRWPNLWAWFVTTKVGDRHEFDPAKITFQREGSIIKATLNHPGLRRSLTKAGNTLFDALDRLDRGIVDPESIWTTFKRKGQGIREVTDKKK